MNKYQLLVLLNTPFVLYGLGKAVASYKKGSIQRVGLLVRVVFWLGIVTGLIFAETIYVFLTSYKLTDSAPLSIADVVLVTGVNLSFFLILRIYAKIESLEKHITDLNEKLSIQSSIKS